MERPAISVIIPVYKAESYLRRCLDSIRQQTFSDFEVLLIDDGSPDQSGVICDEYVNYDNRFRVIHKENGGLPSARKVGVDNAKGKYSIQFDPDDWIEANMLQLLYEKAVEENANVVVCDFYKDYSPISSEIVTHKELSKNRNCILDYFLTGKFQASFWNKLILHELYINKNITFNLELSRWEDVFILCNLLNDLTEISFVYVPLYHYDLYSNKNSLIRFANMRGLKSQIIVTDYFCKMFENTSHEKSIRYMKAATKGLAYDVLDTKGYLNLYSELNKEVVKGGVFGQEGLGSFFRALTVLTRSKLPQHIYMKLQNLRLRILCLKKHNNY